MKSSLARLSSLASLALVGVGIGAYVAPRFVSRIYGVGVEDPHGRLYLRGVGSRDMVLGAIIAHFVDTENRAALRATLACTVFAGVNDAVLVARERGGAAAPNLVVHVSGILGLVYLALLAAPDERSDAEVAPAA